MVTYLKDFLKENIIEDIFLLGFIDADEEIPQFYPNKRFIYFKFNTKYIKFESIEQCSKLKFDIIDSVEFDIDIDEDILRGKSSIIDIILDDSMSIGNYFKTLIFYNYNIDNDEIVCDALEITLVNEQIIFLDPSYYFGINVGGENQKKIWQNNVNEQINTKTKIVNI